MSCAWIQSDLQCRVNLVSSFPTHACRSIRHTWTMESAPATHAGTGFLWTSPGQFRPPSCFGVVFLAAFSRSFLKHYSLSWLRLRDSQLLEGSARSFPHGQVCGNGPSFASPQPGLCHPHLGKLALGQCHISRLLPALTRYLCCLPPLHIHRPHLNTSRAA